VGCSRRREAAAKLAEMNARAAPMPDEARATMGSRAGRVRAAIETGARTDRPQLSVASRVPCVPSAVGRGVLSGRFDTQRAQEHGHLVREPGAGDGFADKDEGATVQGATQDERRGLASVEVDDSRPLHQRNRPAQ
jgi:hypothetical protein